MAVESGEVGGLPVEVAMVGTAPATAEELLRPALVNYGHYTTMQARGGRVRGLAHHLDRLDGANRELFGTGIDRELVCDRLRWALDRVAPEVTVRITVFDRGGSATAGVGVAPEVLVTTSTPIYPDFSPMRVRSAVHQRVLPHLKHMGTLGLMHERRMARRDGFDDVLFTDAGGRVSEGSIWNVGFFDGERIIWPDAPMLTGITMRLLGEALDGRCEFREIRLGDLPELRSAFAVNSITPGRPIASIDDVRFAVDSDLIALLSETYDSVPWDRP
ncbi:aminotransferase class IV family protein [Thermopolyspora sp. NPDC052614]|uniref:aminotransferase class IV family protein n=1 Tax=Thermopolyspora sp. NPDC052614 TaxID=3155682 RepID=UPI00341C4CB6